MESLFSTGLVTLLLVGYMIDCVQANEVCLSCNDVLDPTNCDTVMRCTEHEKCFIDTYISSMGYVSYGLGCRNTSQCSSVDDKSSSSHRHTDHIPVCSECCTGTVCNSAGCGRRGFDEARGPLCYNCGTEQTGVDDCNKLTVCGQDQVCMLHRTTTAANNEVKYKTGCQETSVCQTELAYARDALSIFSPQSTDSHTDSIQVGSTCLIRCCQGDLCNDECSNSTKSDNIHPSATSPHTNSIIAHVTTPGHVAAVSPRDSCLSNPCMRGNCTNSGDSYACACDVGFWGEQCEKAIDYCQPNPCTRGSCSNILGTFVCSCDVGYTGVTCNEVDDPCDPNPCKHGACGSRGGNYSCMCYVGYSGRNCEQLDDPCDPNPCQNGACGSVGGNYSCLCDVGYSGSNCEQHNDPCVPNPCQNGACASRGGNYYCMCDFGYIGRNCEQFTSPCSFDPCHNNATCSDINKDFKCECQSGWTGRHCTMRVCPTGWEEYGPKCMLFDQNIGRSFHDAKQYCNSLGGTLVHVYDQQKNDYIKKLLNQRSTYQYWLGITDAEREGQYQMVDSDEYVHFYDWAPGEPNDSHIYETEDCVVYSSYVPNWQWTDIDCQRRDAYTICENW